MRIALPGLNQRGASPEAALPLWAPSLWRLAYIAVGDDRSATALVAEVLVQAPDSEGAAVRMLVERLPEGWLSWPGAAGPAEWLRLKLRREQADRLLSVLGEWSACERLALGLYLLWDIPRDQLDAWLGTRGMSAAVAELIAHVGDSLDLLNLPDDDLPCASFKTDLLEAHESHAPQPLRLHLLGCHACRAHAAGLRRSMQLVRHALDVFFRQPAPDNLAARAVTLRQTIRQPIYLPTTLLPVLVVVLLMLGLVLRPQAAPTAAQGEHLSLSAADVLDRALDRFASASQHGVFHEQALVGSGEHAMVIERWFDDWRDVRITVRPPTGNQPFFDLSSDGKSWVSYRSTPPVGPADDALVQGDDIKQLLPVLRQLPFVGSFGSMPVDQQSLDVALIAQARRPPPALLGTTQWNDRPAYLLSSKQPDNTRLLLLVDRQSFSLLRAQIVAPNAVAPLTVWQAQVVETLKSAPMGTFEPLSNRTVQRPLNPRHIAPSEATAALASFTPYMRVPIPTALPEAALTSYLHALDGPSFGVLQVYESEWSTLAIVTPRIGFSLFPRKQPEHPFRYGRYATSTSSASQVTMVEFVLDDEPERPNLVYFWHALADEAEREQMLAEMLNSLEVADQTTVDRYAGRFAVWPGQTNTSAVPLPRVDQPAMNQTLTPERRYLRAKFRQAER
jgi:hypothetical protein